MAGLVPAIHDSGPTRRGRKEDVDPRNKCGDDEEGQQKGGGGGFLPRSPVSLARGRQRAGARSGAMTGQKEVV